VDRRVRGWGPYYYGKGKEEMEEDRRKEKKGKGGEEICWTNVKLLPTRLSQIVPASTNSIDAAQHL